MAVWEGPESQHHSGQAFLFGIFAFCHNVVIFPAQGFQALPYRWLIWQHAWGLSSLGAFHTLSTPFLFTFMPEKWK